MPSPLLTHHQLIWQWTCNRLSSCLWLPFWGPLLKLCPHIFSSSPWLLTALSLFLDCYSDFAYYLRVSIIFVCLAYNWKDQVDQLSYLLKDALLPVSWDLNSENVSPADTFFELDSFSESMSPIVLRSCTCSYFFFTSQPEDRMIWKQNCMERSENQHVVGMTSWVLDSSLPLSIHVKKLTVECSYQSHVSVWKKSLHQSSMFELYSCVVIS